MARSKPRAIVRQTTAANAASVSTPSQAACVIAPCYQVVEPLDANGALDAASAVVTAAQVMSTASVSDPVALSGKKLKVSINGAPGVVVNLPVSGVGADIPRAAVVNALNTQLTGAFAELVDDRLVIRTSSAGESATLQLQAVADDAYTALALNTLVGTLVSGLTYYQGLDADIPFRSLPSPKADIDDVVVDDATLNLYVVANRAPRALSRSEAVGMNSFVGGSSASANVARDRAVAPAFGAVRTPGFALRQEGGQTNKVLHLGREAEVTVPLGEEFKGTGGTQWPDTSLTNYLHVEAIGLQLWAQSEGAEFGNFPGSSGNAARVIISSGAPAGEVNASWNGVDTLTIAKGAGATFATLEAALQAVAGMDSLKDLILTLSYAPDHANVEFIPDAVLPVTFYLAGGEDPVRFTADAAVGYAQITGAVNIENADTAADLGIDGETLELSVNGGPWQQVTLTDELVNGGMTGALQQGTDYTAAVTAITPTHAAADGDGLASVNVLSIRTVSADYRDSTLAVRASARVLEALFGGRIAESAEPVANLTPVGLTATIQQAAGDFNARAAVPMQVGLRHGSVTMTLQQMRCLGMVVMAAQNDGAALAGVNPVNLVVAKSNYLAGADQTVALDLSAVVGTTSLADIHAAWTAAAPAPLRAEVDLDIVTIGGTDYLVMYDANPADGQTITLDSVATAADLVNFLGAEVFDEAATTVSTSATIRDNGANFAMQVTSVGNSLSNVVKVSSLGLSTTVLTALLLDAASPSSIDYQAGEIVVNLRADTVSAVGTGMVWDGASAVSISYSRAWGCVTGPTSPSYGNVLFQGGHRRAMAGDMLMAAGAAVGRIVAFADFSAGSTTYTGAVMVLQNYPLNSGTVVDAWYIKHAQLDDDTLGRISPEVVVNPALQMVSIKQGVQVDSAGFAAAGVLSLVYVEYRALRLDVTRSLQAFSDVAQMEAAVGPVSPDNPFAFGLLYAMLNAGTGRVVRGIAVDEVSDDAPMGTLDAFARCYEVLARTSDPYLLVQAGSRSAGEALSAHTASMAARDNDQYRIGLHALKRPTELEPTIVASGEATLQDIGGGKFELTFSEPGINLATAIDGTTDANGNAISAGIGTVFSPSQGVFLDRAGDPYKYLVTKVVSASVVEIDTNDLYVPDAGPGTGGNGDGYYQEDAAALSDFLVSGEACSIGVRQAGLDTSTVAGREQVCSTLSTIAENLGSLRHVVIQPNQVVVEYNGTEYLVDAFYAACAFAGMASAQPPQQPLNKIPLVGIVRTVGSWDLFSEDEMAIAAQGGVLWLIQDNAAGSVYCRHQLTTDTTDATTAELSAVRAVDQFSVLLWRALAPYAGVENLTDEVLDALQVVLQSLASRYAGNARGRLLREVTYGEITIVEDGTETGVQVVALARPHRVANVIQVTVVRT